MIRKLGFFPLERKESTHGLSKNPGRLEPNVRIVCLNHVFLESTLFRLCLTDTASTAPISVEFQTDATTSIIATNEL